MGGEWAHTNSSVGLPQAGWTLDAAHGCCGALSEYLNKPSTGGKARAGDVWWFRVGSRFCVLCSPHCDVRIAGELRLVARLGGTGLFTFFTGLRTLSVSRSEPL